MSKGAPNINLKTYRDSLNKIVRFNHECYDLLRWATSLSELESTFIYELDKRFQLIKSYCSEDEINIEEVHDCSSFVDFDNTTKCLSFAENYLYALYRYSEYFLKADSLEIMHISLSELMCKQHFFSKQLDELEFRINDYYEYTKTEGELNFFDYYDKGDVLNCRDGYEVYKNIKLDLESFLLDDNLREYKNLCKRWYGKGYDESKVFVNPLFLRDRLEEIFSNIVILIEYLKKADLYDKYIEKLRCGYINNSPYIKLKDKAMEMDIASYYSPNWIVNLDLNFNLHPKILHDKIDMIYKFIHSASDKDYNVLFEDTANKEIRQDVPIRYAGNKSKFINHVKKKFHRMKDDDLKLRVHIEYFILILFNFDCLFLRVKHENIEDSIKDFFQDITDTSDKYISRKDEYYDFVLKNVVFQNYKKYTIGSDLNNLLPDWCNIY